MPVPASRGVAIVLLVLGAALLVAPDAVPGVGGAHDAGEMRMEM